MGKTLYLECNSGISGDMTVGALLDLGADQEVLKQALESLGVDGYHLHFGRTDKCGISAFDFDVHLEDGNGHSHEHDHEDGHEHEHACEDGHSHEYGHEHAHAHEDGHNHTHEHAHEDGHSHEHEHEDGHNHEHGHEHAHANAAQDAHTHEHTHAAQDAHTHEHTHSHPHVHRNLYDIYAIIDGLQSSDSVKNCARRIFEIVAQAESKAHGLPIEQVHFHEVGAIDSIVDIISTAVCLDNLGIDDVIVSPLAEGHGYVHCQHGTLPVPVPATANIAQAHGLKMRYTDNDGEMVTPTGAAIAAALRTGEQLPESYRILKIGIGAGNKDFNQANILRAMLIEPEENRPEKRGTQSRAAASLPGQLTVLETNIDDGTGEMLGYTMELLLAAGAKDAWHTPIYMKKNRPAYQLSVLCTEETRESLEDIIFTHTTSIGIRRYAVERTMLERREQQVETPYGTASVKVCTHRESTYYYPEYDSVRSLCQKQKADFGTVYQAAAQAAKQQNQ